MIQVAAAIIENELGKLLIARRKEGNHKLACVNFRAGRSRGGVRRGLPSARAHGGNEY
ncbi:hypothetical protein J2T12_005410 [Paenibacillus anaericanus]|uniref:hypothetical protein n=1 Tax=Paenibacillus anaericanus TaxID=170367 RepID=UPI002788824D|nr:hypothetical protein [Paenibacillus anaericanus]MDQ0091966.1 hypothetical protein [Paenibacillus anaericanus]